MTDLRALDDAAVARFLGEDPALEGWIREALPAVVGRAHRELREALRGTIAFELVRSGAPAATYSVRFEGGQAGFVGTGPADLTVTVDAVLFARLLGGQSRAALLYLSDDLALKGDELLALALDAVLVSAASEGALVDPTALDPVEVSRAIKDVSTEHLQDVMGGALRPVVVSEVFRRLPEFLIERKAARVDLAVGFRIEAPAGQEPDRYLVEVRRGDCRITREPSDDVPRDVTLLLDGPGFLRLVLGHTNPVRAVMSGTLRLKGDPGKALTMNSVVRIPKP